MNKFCISQFFENFHSLLRVTCEIYKKWGTTSYHCPTLHFQLELAILVKFKQNKLSQDQKNAVIVKKQNRKTTEWKVFHTSKFLLGCHILQIQAVWLADVYLKGPIDLQDWSAGPSLLHYNQSRNWKKIYNNFVTIIRNEVFKINFFPQKSIKYKINWTVNPVFFISETAAKSNWYLN